MYNVIFPETKMRVNLGIGCTFKSRSTKRPENVKYSNNYLKKNHFPKLN